MHLVHTHIHRYDSLSAHSQKHRHTMLINIQQTHTYTRAFTYTFTTHTYKCSIAHEAHTHTCMHASIDVHSAHPHKAVHDAHTHRKMSNAHIVTSTHCHVHTLSHCQIHIFAHGHIHTYRTAFLIFYFLRECDLGRGQAWRDIIIIRVNVHVGETLSQYSAATTKFKIIHKNENPQKASSESTRWLFGLILNQRDECLVWFKVKWQLLQSVSMLFWIQCCQKTFHACTSGAL